MKELDADNSHLKEQTERLIVEIAQFEQMTKTLIDDNTSLLETRGKTNADLGEIQQSFDSLQKSYASYLEWLSALVKNGRQEVDVVKSPNEIDSLISSVSERCSQERALPMRRSRQLYNERLNFF